MRQRTEAAWQRKERRNPGRNSRKELSLEPEPHQQSRWTLLEKGEREHPPPRFEDQGDGDHWYTQTGMTGDVAVWLTRAEKP